MAVAVEVMGCATHPPVARVTTQGEGAATMNAILALPTRCWAEGLPASSCSPQAYVQDHTDTAAPALPPTFAELIDPLLRMKLELAGYTLADAESMQLRTSERTVRSSTISRGAAAVHHEETTLSAEPTVASLPEQEQHRVASSIGLSGVASSTLIVSRTGSGRMQFGLNWELRSLPDGALALQVRCTELYEFPEETASVLANCVGDGVLALRAPEAILGEPR